MIIDQVELLRLACSPHAALEIGKAAEHLVCANLILSGYRCYLSDQGLPYDVVVDISGRLIRVQVKAVCFPKNINAKGRAERLAYSFHVRRRGKKGASRLTDEDCDVVALVALDIGVVAYLPIFEVGQTCQLMPPGYSFQGRFVRTRVVSIEGFPFSRALERIRSGPEALKALGQALHSEGDLVEIGGERRTLKAWALLHGVPPEIVPARLRRGWSLFDAVSRKASTSWSRRRGARATGEPR